MGTDDSSGVDDHRVQAILDDRSHALLARVLRAVVDRSVVSDGPGSLLVERRSASLEIESVHRAAMHEAARSTLQRSPGRIARTFCVHLPHMPGRIPCDRDHCRQVDYHFDSLERAGEGFRVENVGLLVLHIEPIQRWIVSPVPGA